MRVAVVHNADVSGVINVFGQQNREKYNPRTVERVAAALERGGHNVAVIDGNMHVVDQLRDFMPRVLAHERPGMVFNMAYGIQGVSRYTHLPAMLEMLGVPYVGSGPQAHGLALDKVVAKMLFESSGLPTPRFWNFASADDEFDDLEFPLIVKPKMEAVSYGITVVRTEAELRGAVAEIIREFGQHVLVEAFVPGRELAIGLLGNAQPEVLPIVEIDLEGDPDAIQTAGDKLSKPREKVCPAPLTDDQRTSLESLARRAFSSLGLYDFARVDLRIDERGEPFILEINSMASLGMTGTYVKAAEVAGYSYDALINRMLDVAAVRYFGEAYVEDSADKSAQRETKLSSRVRSHLRSNVTTIEDQLRHMVDMRTPANNAELVDALGDWVSNRMRDLGFNREVYTRADGGNALYFTNHSERRNDVLILGHLDTAPGPFHAYREEGRRLTGAGVAEHKAGIAVLIAALRALRFARRLRRVKVGVLLTADETVSGGHGGPIVHELAGRSSRVIGLKAADEGGGIVVSRSGRATYRIEAHFTRSGREDLSAEAATTAFLRRLAAVLALTDADAGVRIGITRVNLQGSFGELPEEMSALVTVRFNDPEDAARLDEQVRSTFSKVPRGMLVQVQGGVQRAPMVHEDGSQQLYAQIEGLARDLHVAVRPVHRWHSSQISSVPSDIPVLDGFGAIGGDERTRDEHVLRGTIVDRAALLAMTIAASRG